ncbi:hypothetical protein LOAG_13186 [Loa loa]|uniref:DUF19 domain-containing protein n=1 Tax=Loa loa TaxID=7209 RepID=A0A1S0TKC8_LOALO|nr:hypothetical protein LOAG_13186 [Loa loa]EFO15326.2 hypothetical protein LOAG_13186 [Loa loa]
MTILFSFLIIFSGYGIQCELIRQCTCDEIRHCRERMLSLVKPCADKCQRYANKVEANYEMLKNCFLQNEEKLSQTINCTQNIFHNACATKPGYYVQKIYFESLEIAGLAEINRVLGDYARTIQPLIAIGRRFLRCARDCIDRSSKYCYDHLKCGLNLPSNSEIIQKSKHCAIINGFDNIAIQQICFCAASAGISDEARLNWYFPEGEINLRCGAVVPISKSELS